MNYEKYCENIRDKLARLVTGVELDAGANLHSINIHAESFFREFLNVLYGWELTNANAVDPNAKGVDLLDPRGNVAVQVSSTTTADKIQKSLEKTAKYIEESGRKYGNGFQNPRFCFVAVKAELPEKDQKAIDNKTFDTHGLRFTPKDDILTAKSLHAEAAKCGDIARLKRLSDLADAYYEQKDRKTRWKLFPLGSGTARTDFEYNAGAVPFLGREAEMARLLDFVRGREDRPFRWWAVTAPGAAGKTRLAYELQNRLLEEGGWEVASLSPEAYRTEDGSLNLLRLSDCFPERTLLIADYVQQHTEALGAWMAELSAPEFSRAAPLRLLLLERDVKDENGRYPWLEQIKNADYHISQNCYEAGPLELRPLRRDEETGEDPLLKLIRDFADHLCGKETAEAEDRAQDGETPALIPLPPGGEEQIRERLDSVDKGLVRPLFAMLLADAWVHDPQAPGWQREDLLNYIVEREWGFAAKRLAAFHPQSSRALPAACRLLWAAATVLGANGENAADPETLKAAMPNYWAIVEKCAARHEEELLSPTLSPAEALLTGAGLLNHRKIPALRPDLLGEFFVLKTMEAMSPDERSAFFAAALSDWEAAETFFRRCLSDYEKKVCVRDETGRSTDLRDWFLPADLDLTDPQISNMVRVIWGLFDAARSAALRGRLLSRMEAWVRSMEGGGLDAAHALHDLADVYRDSGAYGRAIPLYKKALRIKKKKLPKDSPDTAATWNNLALAYRAMGEYPKALEYYGKSLAIKEKVLGKDHPDTATTYNNLALVYQAMGDYAKALEYYEKALAIRENVLGKDHPDTAATWNNLGGAYRTLGDYPKALEYYEKALAIRETVLGKDHPDTATTWNNLGGVYQAMGDFPKALESYEKALATKETVLGKDHPSTATTCNNIGVLYWYWDKPGEALPWLRRALAVREKVLGPDHPDTKSTRRSLEYAERWLARR